jgi:hypothetical protein
MHTTGIQILLQKNLQILSSILYNKNDIDIIDYLLLKSLIKERT